MVYDTFQKEWMSCHIMLTKVSFLVQIQYQISYFIFQLPTRSIIPEISTVKLCFFQLTE